MKSLACIVVAGICLTLCTPASAELRPVPCSLAEPPPAGAPKLSDEQATQFAKALVDRLASRVKTLEPAELHVDVPTFDWAQGELLNILTYFELSPAWDVLVLPATPLPTILIERSGADQHSIRWIISAAHAAKHDAQIETFLGITRATSQSGRTSVVRLADTLPTGKGRSRLHLEGATFSVEFLELSSAAKLPETEGALEELERLLSSLRTAVVPDDPLRTMKNLRATAGKVHEKVNAPHMQVRGDTGEGLEVTAWVNAQEPGVTELRARDAHTNKPLSLLRSQRRLQQRLGWTEDAGELMRYETSATVPETQTGFGKVHDVVFELWFTPDHAARPARKLTETRREVEGWER
jgi:hypothetical protein